MTRATVAIEQFFRRRYDKEAIFLPSGRLGLFLAFREWLNPGDRLLMSPINDDVVFFTVLAAGVIPVLAPVDERSGNMDPDSVSESTWRSLRAVMTTNLYGIADRMDCLVELCRRHNLLLIEDACQALDSRFEGHHVGGFSSVAVFSLSKHIAGTGGVLAFSESWRKASLVARLRAEILTPSLPPALGGKLRGDLGRLAEATGTAHFLRVVRRHFLPRKRLRLGHRMAYDLNQVLQAKAAGGGLGRFDYWVGIDNRRYRVAPPDWAVASTLQQLESLAQNREMRRKGTGRLLQLGLTDIDARLQENSSLFRVPLFVQNREQVLSRFAELGLDLDYIYDPPLDIYAAPQLAEIPSTGLGSGVQHWSRNVLPVDPLKADLFLKLRSAVSLAPAIPSPSWASHRS